VQQLKTYSQITDEVTDLGLPSEDADALLQLGDMMATSRPGVIVFLQPWSDE
jgi:hypothetical protein